MSYILDALQKAEAERKLGAVPGIHTPATHVAATERRSGRTLWLGGALMLLAAALAALAWLRPWPATQTAVLPVMPDPAQAAAERRPAAPPEPLASLVPAAPKPVPAPDKSSAKTLPAKPAKPKAAASRAPQPVQKPETVQAGERQDKEPLTLHELPEQIQREIPALAIGGYIYSSNPAERSLLINNKLLREGDEVTPGLTLEKMMRGSVLLYYKGYRYRMPY